MSGNGPEAGDEDVLSSIRRLVRAELGSAIDGAKDGARRSDALVLTPALRVSVPAGEGRRARQPAPARPPASSGAPEAGLAMRRTLEDRIRELEAAVDPRQVGGDWEPDGSEDQGQHVPRAVILPHPGRRGNGAAVDAHAPAAPEPETAGPARTALPPATAAPERGPLTIGAREVVLDEAMLRDLVGEIVREELRGALGERITRTVRKLVRAEIRRLLATEFGR